MIVRDPVVLTATLPRFLRTGDSGAVQLELDNVEGAAGDYSIDVSAPTAADARRRQAADVLKLAPKQRDRVAVPVVGLGRRRQRTSTCTVSGPNGFTLARAYTLDVRPATQILTRRTVQAAGQGRDAHARQATCLPTSCPAPAAWRCRSRISTSLDAATLLNALDRYPFGCSEQIASRAHADALSSTSWPARRSSRSTATIDAAHPRRDRTAAGAAGFERLVRAVERRRRATSGSTPMSPTS